MRLIQINLNYCRVAQDLLAQTTYESTKEIAIISERGRNLDGGVWVTGLTSGFVWAKICGIFVYGCYAPSTLTLPEFEDLLDDLVHDARGRGPKVIAGCFNAWAIKWGSKEPNARRRCLLEAFQLVVILTNEGDVNTYRKGGTDSIVDLTFVSPALARDISSPVSEAFTYSDHQATTYELRTEPQGRRPASQMPKSRRISEWSAKAMDEQKFMEVWLDLSSKAGTFTDRTLHVIQSM